jgi:membrane dipeptidase
MEHMEHALSVAGPEHVGIGTDFDGVDDPVLGLEEVSKLPRLIDAMQDRGFSEGMIRQIMGENYLRLIRAVLNRGQTG